MKRKAQDQKRKVKKKAQTTGIQALTWYQLLIIRRNNLIYTHKISLSDALSDCSLQIPTLDRHLIYFYHLSPCSTEEDDGLAVAVLRGKIFFEQYRAMLLFKFILFWFIFFYFILFNFINFISFHFIFFNLILFYFISFHFI